MNHRYAKAEMSAAVVEVIQVTRQNQSAAHIGFVSVVVYGRITVVIDAADAAPAEANSGLLL